MNISERLLKIEPIRFSDLELPDRDSITDEQLDRLAKLKNMLLDREDKFAIRYYKPQSHQDKFHKSLKKLRLITGGNQSGKTMATTTEGIQLSLGLHPYRKIRVPNKGRVVASDLQKGIGEVIEEKYIKYAPKSEIQA